MAANLYIAVSLGRPEDLRTLDRALYSSSQVVTTFPNGRLTKAIVETTGQNEGQARFLADYQADRLWSFPFAARVHYTLGDALEAVQQ